ncbi:MAG: hypothetical protein KC502_05505 [Myxococcales bacterium]|nr:hypothetical protein [Myxococcales bacterium]
MLELNKRIPLILVVLALYLTGCGGPDFEAVKGYTVFLEGAKEPLQKMNRVREELFQLNEANEMAAKFKDDLLPEVKKLSKLAEDHETPEVKKLSEIHVTLRNVLKDYAADTQKLVDTLDKAQKAEKDGVAKAKAMTNEAKKTEAESKAHTAADRAREQALVVWGESDQKFGSRMQSLVESLTKYLDKQMKR